MQKSEFVIILSHGDYDDHIEAPIMIVPDQDTAILICEAIRAEDPDYMEYLPDCFKGDDAISFEVAWMELPVVAI